MPEKDWERLGDLAEGSKVGAVSVSSEGFGLLGVTAEASGGTLLERMKGRRAQLHRAGDGALIQTWDGPGWIQSVDCLGNTVAVVFATLKPSGTGSDYHLLLSTDGGREWQSRGPIPAPSLAQVLVASEREVWVLGSWYLGRTADAGTTWSEVELEGERNPYTERLRRVEGGVALLGRGVWLAQQGGASWTRQDVGAARVVEGEGRYVLALVDGQGRLGERQGSEVQWREPKMLGREPLRLASSEGLLRMITRGTDPAKGVDLMIHTSEDAGRSWVHQALPLFVPPVDIAGREWALGTVPGPRITVYGRVK